MSAVVDFFAIVLSSFSFYVSYLAYKRHLTIERHAGDAFATVGVDMGNHEFRIENLENHLGLKTVSSPSVQSIKDELAQEETNSVTH